MTEGPVPSVADGDGASRMLGRARTALSRFPAHMDAVRPGKQLQSVANAIAAGLDDLSASLAAVRRAHRLGHADATMDLLLLGALHRIGATEVAPLDARLARLRTAADALQQAIVTHDDSAREASAETLCDLLGIAGAPPRLALFAPPLPEGSPPDTPPDLAAAAPALAAALARRIDSAGRREVIRARIAALCKIHSRGNGTVRALLDAAASALDLEIDDGRAEALKEQFRPTVTVTTEGAVGTTRYAYVVVARSRSKNVDRVSAEATLATGNPTLSSADGNVLAWAAPPDARDLLVFRVANGANATAIGLLTPTALGPTTTTFRDTGQAPSDARLPDPEVDDALFHSGDRFWHAAFVRERSPLLSGLGASEIIGMEENPVRRELTPDTPRAHAELFRVYRRGFGRSLLQVRITGAGNRSVGPMLVNRDEGIGIGFAGIVPDGTILVFDEAGRVSLEGRDVTASAFAWQGACFAADDDDPAVPRDFVFGGPGVDPARRAMFAVATPFDALDGAFAFPHAGDPIPMPGIGIGTTRFAFFVQEAHFASMDDTVVPNVPVPLSPRPHGGILDMSVFAPPGDAEQSPSAGVALSWLEHEAYALRILLPRRFAQFDSPPPELGLADLVGRALERHRPAGVQVRVEYAEDRWILGGSDVTAADTADPILSLRGGSVLWALPAPNP
jgi:hypothetical protein